MLMLVQNRAIWSVLENVIPITPTTFPVILRSTNKRQKPINVTGVALPGTVSEW